MVIKKGNEELVGERGAVCKSILRSLFSLDPLPVLGEGLPNGKELNERLKGNVSSGIKES